MLSYYAPNLNALLFVECITNLKKKIINGNWRMKESCLLIFGILLIRMKILVPPEINISI